MNLLYIDSNYGTRGHICRYNKQSLIDAVNDATLMGRNYHGVDATSQIYEIEVKHLDKSKNYVCTITSTLEGKYRRKKVANMILDLMRSEYVYAVYLRYTDPEHDDDVIVAVSTAFVH